MVIFNRQRLACAIAAAWMSAPACAQDPLELQPTTVVTAAGHEQNIAQAPASISVITREQLEAQSYTSVIDAMKNVPGVYVSGGGNQQDITIRGMGSEYTLVLVDGRPISAGRQTQTNGTSGGKQQLALPPLAMIERIEVIRGPMSSLYGSEAMGGVINIITRRSSGEWAGTVRGQKMFSQNDYNEDEYHTELFAGGALIPGLMGLQLSGAYTHTYESDYVGGEAFNSGESKPEARESNVGADLFLTPTDADRFTLGYREVTQKSRHTAGKSSPVTTSLPEGEATTNRFEKEVWTLSHEGNYGDWLLNSYLQRDVSERVQDLSMEETVNIFNTQGTYFWGSHTITLGAQYKDEEFVNGQNVLFNDGIAGGVHEADRWLAAIYGEVEWGVTDDFALTTGLRYNDDEFFGGHLSPRVYGVYSLTPTLTLKGGVSTGYKQPTLTQATEGFGGRTGGGGSPNVGSNGQPLPRALSIGNPDLEPETSTSYEVGFVFDDPSIGLGTSVMLFHTVYKDKIAEDRFCTSPNAANNNDVANYACNFGGNNFYFLSTTRNIDKAVIQGLEFTLDYAITDDLSWMSSYTFTDSEQKSGEFKGEPLNKQPRHMFNTNLDWQVTDKLNLWSQYNYRSRTSDYLSRTSMSEGTPGYGFVDIGAVYGLSRNVDLTAGLYNVANKEVANADYEVVLDGRRLVVGVTVDF